MPIIVVPKPLREKLGEEAVDSLVELLNQSEDKTKGDVIALSQEKFERRLSEEISGVKSEIVKINSELKEEIAQVKNGLKAEIVALEEKFERRLSEEISKVRVELTDEISKVRVELTDEISKVRVELTDEISKVRVELSELKSDIIKWMFVFWIGQIGTILGILFAFFK